MANREETWRRLVDQRCQDCEKHCKEAWIVEVLSVAATRPASTTSTTSPSSPLQQLRERLLDLFRQSSNPGLPAQQRRQAFSNLKDLRQRVDEMIARGMGLVSTTNSTSNGNAQAAPAASTTRATAPVSATATGSSVGGSVASTAPKSVVDLAGPARPAPPTATVHKTATVLATSAKKPDATQKETSYTNNGTIAANKPTNTNGTRISPASASTAPVRPSQPDPPAKRKSSIADLAAASAATVQEAASALPPNFSYTGSSSGSKHPSATNAQRPRSGSTSQQTQASTLPPPPAYERRSQQVPAKKIPATSQASSASSNKRSRSPTPTPATKTNHQSNHTASTPVSKKAIDPPPSSDSAKRASVAKKPSVQKATTTSPSAPATPASVKAPATAMPTMNQSSTNLSPQMQAQQQIQQQMMSQMNWGYNPMTMNPLAVAQQYQENPALALQIATAQAQAHTLAQEAYRAQCQKIQAAQMQMAQQQAMMTQQPPAAVAACQNGNQASTTPGAKTPPKPSNQTTPRSSDTKAKDSSSTAKLTSNSQKTVNGTKAVVSEGATTSTQSTVVGKAPATSKKSDGTRNGETPANGLTNGVTSKSISKETPRASASSNGQSRTAALSNPAPSAVSSSNVSASGASPVPSRPQVMRPTHRTTSNSSTTSQQHSQQPNPKRHRVDAPSAGPPEPDVVTSLASTTVVFVADDGGSASNAGAQKPRGNVALRFRPREMSHRKQTETFERLQRWEPTWQVITTVAAGVTSPIDEYVSIEAPLNNPNTAAKIVLRDLAANQMVRTHMRWGKTNTTTLTNPKNEDLFLVLRMLPLNPPSEKADCHLWPKGTFLTVNSKPVKIRQRKQAGHKLLLWEYPSYALDLGRFVESPTKPPTVALCCYDAEPFIYTLSFCRYWSPDVISRGLLSSKESVLTWRTYKESLEKAMRLISSQFVVIGEEDEDVGGKDESVGKLIFSLVDPVSKVPMKTPVRGTECKHWQCFDLEYFLKVNAPVYGGRWRCVCCERYVSYRDLEVCAVTHKALRMFEKEVSSERNRVEFHADESFCLLPPQKLRYNKVKQQSDVGDSGSDKPGKPDVEIIDLV